MTKELPEELNNYSYVAMTSNKFNTRKHATLKMQNLLLW